MMKNNSDANRRASFLQAILLVIKRFGQDLLGILFICIGIISVLNAFNLTRGKLIDQWVELIFRWFGLGAYFLIVILTLSGMVILLRHLERFPRFDFTKLLNLEVLLFSFSALLSIIGKSSVERANDGLDGGVIGWGTARLLTNAIGDLPAYLLLVFINVILIINVLGLYKKIVVYFDVFFTQILSSGSEKVEKKNPARENKLVSEQVGTLPHENYSDSEVNQMVTYFVHDFLVKYILVRYFSLPEYKDLLHDQLLLEEVCYD